MAEIDFGFLVWWEQHFTERNGREPSPQTRKAIEGVLSSLYVFLTNYGFLVDEDGKAVRNPMLGYERTTVRQRSNDWLRSQEDSALLDTPMTEIEAILVHFLRHSGLRIGEALALRMSDVDLVDMTIRVSDSKTQSGIREIPIVPELVPRIRAWIAYVQAHGAHRPNGYFLCTTRVGRWRDKGTGQVLETAPGGRMRPQTVEKIVRRVGERASNRASNPSPAQEDIRIPSPQCGDALGRRLGFARTLRPAHHEAGLRRVV